MSPIPKIRSAIREGWNWSMASIFSPVPTNLMGLFTTVRIDKAAPPRVSPSNLVSTTPSKSRRSLNSFGRVHGILSGHGIYHEERLVGVDALFDGGDFLHHLFVHRQTSGRIDDDHVVAFGLGFFHGVLWDRNASCCPVRYIRGYQFTCPALSTVRGPPTIDACRQQSDSCFFVSQHQGQLDTFNGHAKERFPGEGEKAKPRKRRNS